MNYQSNDPLYGARTLSTSAAALDQGLRSYMIHVYNLMGLGLGLTALVSYFVASIPILAHLFLGTPLRWVVMLAPLAIVLFFSFRIQSLNPPAARVLFWTYAGLMGLSLSSIFFVFREAAIIRTFFITAATFGAMSLYGYTTRKDLSSFGSFLFMGVIGILIASMVNIFLQSSAMQFMISAIGVLVFTGLTAYDTQAIKESYYVAGSGETAQKYAVMGALKLYLNFINLFISLLQLFGDRRD